MRTLILIGLLIAPLPALGQTFELGPGGFRVYPHGGGNCRELRAACMHKDELGETGQGNCQRYRELCSSGARLLSPSAGRRGMKVTNATARPQLSLRAGHSTE
jgi:hypothetical protein